MDVVGTLIGGEPDEQGGGDSGERRGKPEHDLGASQRQQHARPDGAGEKTPVVHHTQRHIRGRELLWRAR